MTSIAEKIGQVRYSLESALLWENSPLRPRFRLSYPSEQKNEFGEPIFYLKKKGEPNQIMPVLKPRVSGYFAAYPGGLNIDPDTGEIDLTVNDIEGVPINASDTGIRYTVVFTPFSRRWAARTTVVISGIDYLSRIFSLSKSPEEEYIARPFYNGILEGEVPEGEFGITPVQWPTGDLKGLVVDARGNINFRKMIESGSLGFRRKADGSEGCDVLPENGASKEFKLYYQLDDPSQKALNYTTVRLHFYDTVEDIPLELRRRIEQQRNTVTRPHGFTTKCLPLLLGTSMAVFPDSPWAALTALLVALSSLLLLNATGAKSPYRPPESVATG